MGVSVGANVLLGKHIGARDEENASKTVHTAVTFALVVGIAMIFVGFFLSRPLFGINGYARRCYKSIGFVYANLFCWNASIYVL